MANQKGRSKKGYSGARTRASGSKKSAKKPVRREVGGYVCLLFFVIALFSCFGVQSVFTDWLRIGARGLIGGGFYVLPLSLLLSAWILLTHDGRPVRLRVTCAFLLSVTIGCLVHLFGTSPQPAWGFSMLAELFRAGVEGVGGGAVSGLVAMALSAAVSKVVTIILLILSAGFVLITSLNMTVGGIVQAIRQRPRLSYDEPKKEHPDPAQVIVDHVAQRQIDRAQRKTRPVDIDLPIDDPLEPKPVEPAPKQEPKKRGKLISPDELLLLQEREDAAATVPAAVPVPAPEPAPAPAEPEIVLPPDAAEKTETQKLKKEDVQQATLSVAREIEENAQEEKPAYVYPPVDLLDSGSSGKVDGTGEMRANSERLNDTLASFNLDAHIINVVRGPSVTRYELELDRGVKLSRITGLADDIALSLGASGVRISPIPDKISVVGVEVPNKQVSVVHIRDVIQSENFAASKSCISFAVGKDIGGSSIIGDIAKLPHLLIAGTTGSGKSVCMNTLIVSLLYRAEPSDVKLIMIDPKMVELGVYNEIPHLLIPVVTDPKKASGSLQWAVCEMMRRYRLMADAGVRDLDSYNKVAASSNEYEKMPQIVVVIDELADLMLVAAKEVEESICRVAQMGRAAGIHLVIATQRPSADVITGLMKANIPSRIAFAVASAMESRIILDTQGAEKLVGKGDMLFAPLGQGKPTRVQGCYISDTEVKRVVDFIRKNTSSNYDDDVNEQIKKYASKTEKSAPVTADSEDPDALPIDGDELLPQAVDIILEIGQASVSMLQRRLKLGYARAARIVDEMEERGIVGPFSGSKPREILITKEQWEQMKQGEANEPVPEELSDVH